MKGHDHGRLAAVVVAVVCYMISLVFNALAVVGYGKTKSFAAVFFPLLKPQTRNCACVLSLLGLNHKPVYHLPNRKLQSASSVALSDFGTIKSRHYK